jgi:predicted small lipoprotein YifL
MKKVFLSLALVVALSVSFVSCKETKTEEVPVEETEVVAPEVEAPVVDSTATPAADSTATPAPFLRYREKKSIPLLAGFFYA